MKQGGFVEAVKAEGDYWFLHNDGALYKTRQASRGATQHADFADYIDMCGWSRMIANGQKEEARRLRAREHWVLLV